MIAIAGNQHAGVGNGLANWAINPSFIKPNKGLFNSKKNLIMA